MRVRGIRGCLAELDIVKEPGVAPGSSGKFFGGLCCAQVHYKKTRLNATEEAHSIFTIE
jgi:hypothetical protein